MPRPASRSVGGDPPHPAGAGADATGTEATGAGEPLRIGRLSRAHGLKGELEVRLDWPDSRALLEAERVLLSRPDGDSTSYVIASARSTGKGILLRLEGVGDRDAAEARSQVPAARSRGL